MLLIQVKRRQNLSQIEALLLEYGAIDFVRPGPEENG